MPLTLCLALSCAWASVARGDLSPWVFEGVSGQFDQTFFAYLQPITGSQNFSDRVDAELGLAVHREGWRAKVLPWSILSLPHGVAGAANEAHVFFELEEGWVEYRAPSWDFRVGNQIIAWGAADRVNPTDLWNPSNLMDPFLSRKLPLLTARAGIHPAEFHGVGLELLFAPFFRESRLPAVFPDSASQSISPEASRWLLPLPERLELGNAVVPLFYQLKPSSFPSQTWQGGASLHFSPIPDWDFSLSYQNTVERLPRLSLTERGDASDPALPLTVTVSPIYHREQVFGVDGSGAILDSQVTVRFEAAYHLRDNADVAGVDVFQGVAGLDYTLPWRPWGVTTYFDTLAVVYQRIDFQSTVNGTTSIRNLPDVFPWDRNGIVYMENRFTARTKLASSWVWSFRDQDAFLSSVLSVQFSDHLGGGAGGEFFLGARNGFYGQFYDNNRIKVTTSYVF
jgi:hypothetical protein